MADRMIWDALAAGVTKHVSREEAARAGAIVDSTMPDQRGRLCWCGVCGLIAICAPSCDFYTREGEAILRCPACVIKR